MMAAERFPLIPYLPQLEHERSSGDASLWEHFNYQRLISNIESLLAIPMIRARLINIFNKDRRELVQELERRKEEYITAFHNFGTILQDLPQSPTALDSLQMTIPSILPINEEGEESLTPRQMTDRLRNIFATTTQDIVCASASHGDTYAEVRALVEMKPELRGKIGILVFDAHVDANTDDNGTEVLEDQYIGKASWQAALLDQGLAAGIQIIGVPSDTRLTILQDSNPTEGTSTNAALIRHAGKIDVADETKYRKGQRIDREAFYSTVREQILKLQQSGAEYIIYSFDVDSLMLDHAGYTVTPYNPYNALLFLSLLDLISPEEMRQTKVNDVVNCMMIALGSGLFNFFTPIADRELRKALAKHKDEFGDSGELLFGGDTHPHSGLPLAVVAHAIEIAREMCDADPTLHWGVPIGQPSEDISRPIFHGDITELHLRDAGRRNPREGNMARALAAFLTRLHR